jgi:hypothetical protein
MVSMVKHIALLVVIAGIQVGCGSVSLVEMPADGGAAGTGSAGSLGTAADMGRGGSAGSLLPAGSAGALGSPDAGMTGAAGSLWMEKLPFDGGAGSAGGSSGSAGASPSPDAGSAGATGTAGASSCETNVPTSETFEMTACGYTSTDSTGAPAGPFTTSREYSGLVTMKISGLIDSAPSYPLGVADAFYNVDPNATASSVGACPTCLSYNKLDEGACVCGGMYDPYKMMVSSTTGCKSDYLSGLIVGAYPAFNPTHEYTVTLNFGNTPSKIDIGISDCGCTDNSGKQTITLTPVASACP